MMRRPLVLFQQAHSTPTRGSSKLQAPLFTTSRPFYLDEPPYQTPPLSVTPT